MSAASLLGPSALSMQPIVVRLRAALVLVGSRSTRPLPFILSLPHLASPRIPFAEVSLSERLSQRIKFTTVPLRGMVLVSSRPDCESPCSPSMSCLAHRSRGHWGHSAVLRKPSSQRGVEVGASSPAARPVKEVPDHARQPPLPAAACPRRAGKDIFQVDIPEHLIPFGQEACPDWALK